MERVLLAIESLYARNKLMILKQNKNKNDAKFQVHCFQKQHNNNETFQGAKHVRTIYKFSIHYPH